VIVDTQIATDGLRVVLGARRYAVGSPWNRVPLGHISQLAVDTSGPAPPLPGRGADP
jgi:hypothetical protein